MVATLQGSTDRHHWFVLRLLEENELTIDHSPIDRENVRSEVAQAGYGFGRVRMSSVTGSIDTYSFALYPSTGDQHGRTRQETPVTFTAAAVSASTGRADRTESAGNEGSRTAAA